MYDQQINKHTQKQQTRQLTVQGMSQYSFGNQIMFEHPGLLKPGDS
jgi:hypothetical protein